MTEIEYDDFLKHKIWAVDYDKRWLTVEKLDKKIKIINGYMCTYSYNYRFMLVENIKESVIEAIKTALSLKLAFADSDPLETNVRVAGFSNNKYVKIIPKLANIDYCFYSNYYTEYLNITKVKKEDVALGKAMLKWDKTSGGFLLPNGEKIELPDKIGSLTYKQLYNSTITKWVNEIYAMLYSK